MKKLLAILLTLTLVLSLCACGAKTPANTDGSFEDDYQFTYEDTEEVPEDSETDDETEEGDNADEEDEISEEEPEEEEEPEVSSKNDTSSKTSSKNTSSKESNKNNSSKTSSKNNSSKTSSKKNNSSKTSSKNTASKTSSKTEVSSTVKNETTDSSVISSEATSSKIIIELPSTARDENAIACWGDSITEGMGMTDKSYPVRLQEMLGDKFKVYNGGDGGETSNTIAARQGGLKVYTAKNITFSRGKDTQLISTESSDVFVDENGSPVVLTAALGNQLRVNDVQINGEFYTLRFEDYVWSPRSFKLYLDRYSNSSSIFMIPKGSEVVFNSAADSQRSGVDIYMMGANGGYETNDAKYIEQVKAMIKHHGNDKYLIIKPYWTDINGLEKEFGDHVIDFTGLAISEGLEYEGLTPTSGDKTAISKKSIPPSLRYENEADNVHLNEYGYHFLAHCIYEQGKTLGYW